MRGDIRRLGKAGGGALGTKSGTCDPFPWTVSLMGIVNIGQSITAPPSCYITRVRALHVRLQHDGGSLPAAQPLRPLHAHIPQDECRAEQDRDRDGARAERVDGARRAAEQNDLRERDSNTRASAGLRL